MQVPNPIYLTTSIDCSVALRQCEILTNLTYARLIPEREEIKTNRIQVINVSLAIIISQDCDLDLDFIDRFQTKKENSDKLIPNVLLLHLYPAKDMQMKLKDGGAGWNRVQRPYGKESSGEPRILSV